VQARLAARSEAAAARRRTLSMSLDNVALSTGTAAEVLGSHSRSSSLGAPGFLFSSVMGTPHPAAGRPGSVTGSVTGGLVDGCEAAGDDRGLHGRHPCW